MVYYLKKAMWQRETDGLRGARSPANDIEAASHSQAQGENAMVGRLDKQLGKYQITAFLGTGAMAQVYRAFHPTLERDVAIKVIHPRLADDPDFVDRFRHEAKVVAALRHPGIVQVYDFEIEGDTFYMVMEFVPGESLEDHLAVLYERGEWISLDKTLDIFRPIVQAVAYAHDQGVVHRDLKPANVLFTSEGQPVLADFGLSRILGTDRLADSGAIVGTPTYMSPEQGEGKTGDERSDIYSLGVMLYELATGIPPFSADSPVSVILKHLDEPLPPPRSINQDLPDPIEQIIQKALEKDPAVRFQSAPELLHILDEVVLPGALPGAGVPSLDVRCPYRGLQVFEEEHAEFYFGREALVSQLREMLEPVGAANPVQFLAVLGASGSGKSSLLRAGLVPALRGGAVPGSSEWLIQVMKPGSQPLEELAARLSPMVAEEPEQPAARAQLRDALLAQGRALHLAVRRAWPDAPSQRRLLLVIDQFEELFTLCQDERERVRFIENLLYATAVREGRVILVLAMRADFYHRCAAYRDLASRIAARQVLVGPMNEAELRRAVEQPARQVGLQFEAGLVDAILADVARQPGALPLLQHALLELWERRQDRLLTLAAYQASGGVSGAIARRADGVYDSLRPEERVVLRRIMLRLTQPGEGTEDTRRRARKRELLPGPGEGRLTVEGVLQRLVDARLLTTSRDMASGEQVVDVAHEALIRGWVRLQGWIDEDRMALHTHRQLTEAAETWQQNHRDASYLYRGGRLAQAEEWAETHADDLNELEQSFLSVSRTATESREREREATRQRELTQAQALAKAEHQRAEEQARASGRLRWLAIGLAVVFLLAIGAAIWALGEQQRAQAAADLSDSLNLSTSAQLALSEHDTDLALALALEANRIADPPPQARLMLAEVAYAPGTRSVFRGHTASVQSVAISSGPARAALSGSTDGSLILWDLETGAVVRRFEGHEDIVHGVALLPKGGRALSASADRSLILWDLETGEALRRLTGHTDAVWCVAVSPDGRTALSGSADKTLILWDLETGTILRRFSGHEGVVHSVAINPDRRTVLSGSADRSVILWDLETGAILHKMAGVADTVAGAQQAIGHYDAVWAVAFRPDGRTALSVSQDEFAILWDLETEDDASRLVQRFDAEIGLLSMAMSADGRIALLGSLDNRLLLLDLVTGQISPQLRGHTGRVLSVAFTPGDRMALSGSADGTLRLWDLYSGAEMRRIQYTRPPDPAACDVAISPDGQLCLTGLWTGEISLWDYATGEEIRRLQGHTEMVFGGVHFLPDGRRAVSGAGDIFAAATDNTLRVWDVETGQELRRLEGHTDKMWDTDVSTDGRFVASGSHDGTLRLWDLESGTGAILLDVSSQAVRSVAFSPDGQFLVVGLAKGQASSPDYSLRLLETAPGREIRRMAGHREVIADVAFSPDGRRILSGSTDLAVIVWDAASGEEIHRLIGHSGGLLAVAFSPDSRLAVSGATDGSLLLWDVAEGVALRRYVGLTKPIVGLAFTPDGRSFLVAADDDAVHEYRVDATQQDLLAWIAANRHIPELTCQQRERYRIEPLCDEGRD
jgi:WD40 repeat protein/tRNA A-37 threonylcarbamoyl transferase component Bud32